MYCLRRPVDRVAPPVVPPLFHRLFGSLGSEIFEVIVRINPLDSGKIYSLVPQTHTQAVQKEAMTRTIIFQTKHFFIRFYAFLLSSSKFW